MKELEQYSEKQLKDELDRRQKKGLKNYMRKAKAANADKEFKRLREDADKLSREAHETWTQSTERWQKVFQETK